MIKVTNVRRQCRHFLFPPMFHLFQKLIPGSFFSRRKKAPQNAMLLSLMDLFFLSHPDIFVRDIQKVFHLFWRKMIGKQASDGFKNAVLFAFFQSLL